MTEVEEKYQVLMNLMARQDAKAKARREARRTQVKPVQTRKAA